MHITFILMSGFLVFLVSYVASGISGFWLKKNSVLEHLSI